MRAEITQMLRQGGGAIVNTASVLGFRGSVGASAYVASKHGVVGITKTSALEYGRRGIRVNAVCPGTIQTPMTERVLGNHPAKVHEMVAEGPVGRFGMPEEVASAVVWLCSDAASLVNGHILVLDGGATAG